MQMNATQKRRWDRLRRVLTGPILVAPGTLMLAGLILYPFCQLVLISSGDLTPDFSVQGPFGLHNYARILQLGLLGRVALNTAVWTVGTVALQTILGLLSALVLNQRFPGRSVFRTLIFVPFAVPVVVSAMTWEWMLRGEVGIINVTLSQFGLEGRPWLTLTNTAMPALIVTNSWFMYPFVMFALLAAMQAVPAELYEAAEVDGANAWQRFLNITLPGIRPSMGLVMLLMTIWSLNAFSVIYIMTEGGPGIATEILGLTVFRQAFRYVNFESASALAVIMLIVQMIFAATYARFLLKEQ